MSVRIQCHAVFAKPAHGLRINAVFLGKHPRGERIFIVTRQHRHRGLDDDRAVIQLRRDEMHRAAVHTHAGVQRLAVGVQSGERRQQ